MKKTLLLLFIFTSFFAFSQSGNIRGFIYDKESGEPIIFCNVFLEGTTIGAATDINGMYNISKIQPGDYTLTVTYLGYDTTKVEIKLSPRQLLSQNLLIGESSIKLNGKIICTFFQTVKQ